jgi:hypothetical protein
MGRFSATKIAFTSILSTVCFWLASGQDSHLAYDAPAVESATTDVCGADCSRSATPHERDSSKVRVLVEEITGDTTRIALLAASPRYSSAVRVLRIPSTPSIDAESTEDVDRRKQTTLPRWESQFSDGEVESSLTRVASRLVMMM